MNITREQLASIKDALYLADVLNQDLVEDAIDHLCKYVQDRLGIDRGDFAGIYWSSDVPRDVIESYIDGERGM